MRSGLPLLVLLSLLLGGCDRHAEEPQADFAVLAQADPAYAQASPERSLVFPADHGAHPDFRIEWWYLTAVLTGEDGEDYGAQWTLFRTALAPGSGEGWRDPQIWFAHAAATSATDHQHSELFARAGIGQAGVRAEPFEAWIDDWAMIGQPGEGLQSLDLPAHGDGFSYDLTLRADTPVVFHGESGFSQKSPDGQASHYYSQPNYRVTGSMSLSGKTVEVTGEGWLDREWSSQPLREDQEGWDWFSLHFEDNTKLMAYRLRGSDSDYTPGTWIEPDGTAQYIWPGEIILTPLREARVDVRDIPVDWRLEYAAKGVDLTVTALNDQAWNNTNVVYWEGPVRVSGSHAGRGYLEMTGYDPD